MAKALSERYICGYERIAKKKHVCSQARRDESKARSCTGTINPGDKYYEYMGETPAYHSGSAYCIPCAEQFMLKACYEYTVGTKVLVKSLASGYNGDHRGIVKTLEVTGDADFDCKITVETRGME